MDFDVPTLVLVVHVALGLLFIVSGLVNAQQGRPLGLAIQGLLGVLIIGMGVAASRLVAARD